MSQDLIEIRGLVKRYGAVTALAGVSINIQRGEFLSLLGPSGCGKTTLLRSIAGFIDPTEGEILIDGKPVIGVPPNERPVNTVFQNYALFPHMTVGDNIAFGPRRRRVPQAEIKNMVAEALEMVGMGAYAERMPKALSGGQQQRVALARAIVNRPQVLLLDEPLGALDLKLRKRMQVELKRLHEKLGLTFVYVTHDQEEALVMSDRIAVMSEGNIVQLGSGEDIYRTPNSRYVADFIGEANLIDCVVGADGRVRLTVDGPALPYEGGRSAGERTTLMIRPEDIKLGDGAVSIEAKLRDKVFAGMSWRLYVTLANGQEISVQPGSIAAAESLRVGDTLRVGWLAERGRVLAR
ncbi:MAG: ABC transporter ATP-binding protein [Alphaproteobacteria bacterium]